jgi:hypothetical protein
MAPSVTLLDLVTQVAEYAVLQTGRVRISGFLQWVWTYLTGQRGSRLIVDHHASPNDCVPLHHVLGRNKDTVVPSARAG